MKRQSFLAPLSDINLPMTLIIFLLGALGIAMQYSAAGGEWMPWAKPQLVKLLMGWLFFIILVLMPLHWLLRLAYAGYVLCVGLLVGVEVAGDVGLGAQRWIDLGFMRIQPSEFMKPALILALARYYHTVREEDQNHLMMLIPPLLILAIPVLLVLKQPNLGTATVLGFTCVVIFFIAGIRWQYFALVGLVAALSLPIAWQSLHDYQKQRVMTFLDPAADPLGSGYNITQSIIAIGSGGLSGKGFLNGSQAQLDFLPEKQTDFIYTMLAEELGFIGVFSVMLLFFSLLVFALALAMKAKNRFASVMSAGICGCFFAHMFINMAMAMGIVPVVGVPLPFLSYGGTFLLTVMILCGLLMNAYLHRNQVLHRGFRGLL